MAERQDPEQEYVFKNDTLGTGSYEAMQDAQGTPITIKSPPNAVDIGYGSSSAVIGDRAYFHPFGFNNVYEFSNNQWHKVPPCPNKLFTIVSVVDMLTAVGGGSVTQPYGNKLYSFIDNKWIEHFPPMPTRRSTPGAVYANNTLVVAGGYCYSENLNVVEILNTANMQWSIVSSLPVPTNHPSTTICGDYVYIHPLSYDYQEKYSVYKCSLRELTQSQWEKITSLPVTHSSLVTFNGHLLAVGGVDSNGDISKDIYQYNETSWIVTSQMSTPRSFCATTVLPGNKLMVVGGDGATKKCEIATFV
ncbi:uncharacterized protein LOC135350347 [Halichondria panicea]|uniref:uncharacterized protein LOC135350347 n=1 Tax=Halichondria panicea TaxID=6063 RepID=UPI00312B90EB